MIAEAVIAKTPARSRANEAAGTLVLTTERLVFVVDDQVAFEIRRADIDRATQHVDQLWIYPRGGGLGVGFALRSLMAGPVPWRWYFASPTSYEVRMAGAANDPRIGPIDDARRAVLERWRAMVAFPTMPSTVFLDDVPEAPIAWNQIVEIVYIVDGRGDGPPWVLVVRMADGTWAYFQHTVEITGDIYTTMVVARSLETLWWGAMTEDDRDRVTTQMTQERIDEEMVRLDAILGETSGPPCEHAAQRMMAIRGSR